MCSNDMIKKDVEDKLREVFDEVSKWLAFAEAKNGAMIALNGAILAGLLNLLLNKDFNSYFNFYIKIHLCISVLCAVIALVCSLISFLPYLGVFNGTDTCIAGNCILIFYGDIAKYKNEKQYIKDVYKYYFNVDRDENQLSKIELDYGKEIIINSIITVKKCRWFKLALFFTLSALVTPIPVIMAGLIKLLLKKINTI